MKVSVVNDLNEQNNGKLSVQIDVSSNKKLVKLPKSPNKERIVDIQHTPKNIEEENNKEMPVVDCKQDTERRTSLSNNNNDKEDVNDYKSPLDALECKK